MPNKVKRTYLKVSDVIKRLQEYTDEYGDMPIRVRLPGLTSSPRICGLWYSSPKGESGTLSEGAIDIVPKYDVYGAVNELARVNSIVKEFADIKSCFINYADGMMKTKKVLENIQKRGGRCVDAGTANEFKRLYGIAKEIRDLLISVKGFDQRLAQVVKEPFLDSDYCVAFTHHIGNDMSDSEFAKLITEGIGEKTSVQRMAVYQDIIKKINDEVSRREQRIKALEKRVADDKGSNESLNAQTLIKKSEGIIATLMKRREYIMGRYSALKSSVLGTIKNMDSNIDKMIEEHKKRIPVKKAKGRARA